MRAEKIFFKNPYVRIGLVLLGVLVIWLLLHAVRIAFFGPDYTLGGHMVSAVLASLLTIPMIIAARRWLDGGTLAGLGLPVSRAALKPFAVGALAFLLPSAVGFALVLGFGWVTIMPLASVWEIIAFIPLLIVLVFIFEALPEELAFRGYIYNVLAERHSRNVAVWLQAVLFALWGTVLWTVSSGFVPLDRLIMFFAIGLVLGLVRVTTGSVWAAIGLHTAFQTVAQLLLHAERGHFQVEGGETLQLVALGIVPFAFATTLVALVYREPVAWRERESGIS